MSAYKREGGGWGTSEGVKGSMKGEKGNEWERTEGRKERRREEERESERIWRERGNMYRYMWNGAIFPPHTEVGVLNVGAF